MARAMVKKRPVAPMVNKRPSLSLPITPAVIKKVADLLLMFGFDRSFTVIAASDNEFVVQLLGEYKPRVINFVGEKPQLN